MLLAGKRIFVVEDDVLNRAITRIALSVHGARLDFELYGRDTTRRLKQYLPVDAVILDLMLSFGSSGYQLFDEIRADPLLAGIPVVAVSASDPGEAIPRCRDKGFDGFIAKPIDSDLFPEQIARIIRHEPVWYTGAG